VFRRDRQSASTDVPVPDNHTNSRTRTSKPRGVPRSRVGGVWVSAVLFSLVLLLLLIFVLENGQRAEVSFFGAHWHLPMGVALLLAAVCGTLLIALPGTGRIVQLRLLDRRRTRSQFVSPPNEPATEFDQPVVPDQPVAGRPTLP
jgi:lipopolysaccharide assembly protein A